MKTVVGCYSVVQPLQPLFKRSNNLVSLLFEPLLNHDLTVTSKTAAKSTANFKKQFSCFQRFFSSELVLKTVESRFAAFGYFEAGVASSL